MRCPACGARNPEQAEWCGQCYTPLREEPAPIPPEDAPAAPEPPTGPGRPPAPPAARPGHVTASDPRFRRTEEGLDWRCARCGSWSPIERQTCAACDAPFAATMETDGDGPGRRELSESAATVATGALPGLGHILLGATLDGAARVTTYLLWLVGGVVMLTEALGTGGPVLPAVPLLLGAAVVWVASLVDVVNLARGSTRQVLGPRTLLWLVVVVIGTLMLSFLASASRVGLG